MTLEMGSLGKIDRVRRRTRQFARFWQLASAFWRGKWARVAWGLTVVLVVLVLLQLLINYLLNLWNRHFFDGLERRDVAALWAQAQLFLPLAAAGIGLAATSVWGRMTMQRLWRESLTAHVLEYWVVSDHSHRFDNLPTGLENPEYRISQDVRIATDAPVDLVMALVSSVLTAAIFLTVLWNIGETLAFEAFGKTWEIPGHLVIGVVIYSGLFSSAMIVAGRHLTGIVERKNQAEAEFLAAIDQLRCSLNVTGARGTNPAERRTLWTPCIMSF